MNENVSENACVLLHDYAYVHYHGRDHDCADDCFRAHTHDWVKMNVSVSANANDPRSGRPNDFLPHMSMNVVNVSASASASQS